MSSLEFVTPPEAVTNLKVLLYAGPGVGKSVGAGTTPGPILWLNAAGPDALRYARFVHGDEKIREVEMIDKTTLEHVYLYARDADKNGIKSVVVDEIGEVYARLLAARAAKSPGAQKNGGKPTPGDYGDANQDLIGFVQHMRDLPVNVILVAHEVTLDVTDDEGNEGTERFPYCGTNKPSVSQRLMGMVQVVGYVGRVAPETEGGKASWVVQVVPGKSRKGKDRTITGLGDARGVAPLDIAAWVAAETKATS
jgi:hypothetical protein